MQEDNVGETRARATATSENRRGRPRFTPKTEQRRVVTMMAESGIPQEQIARRFGISVPTLCKYFRDELFPPKKEGPVADDGFAALQRRRNADLIARKQMKRPTPPELLRAGRD